MTSGNNAVFVSKINALVNYTVLLRCYANASIAIQWHFNSYLNYVFAGGQLRNEYVGRFRTEDDKAGSHILIIPKVKREDAGLYYCSEEISGRRISTTDLTVLYSSPVCHSNMKRDGFVGPNTCCNLEEEYMVFNCTVSFNGSYPHLIWKSLNGSQSLNSSVCHDQRNRRSCSLILKSNQSYDGSSFVCQTAASSDTNFNCSIEMIKVQYFSATYGVAKTEINEKVECTVQSNANVRFKWKLIQVNKETYLGSDRSLLIPELGLYQCEVEYSIRNVSCVFLVSTVTASVETKNATLHYVTTSGSTTLAVILSIVSVFTVLSIGMFMLIRKRKRKRKIIESQKIESRRIQNKIRDMQEYFVSNVDPQDILEPLIHDHVISEEDIDNVLKKATTEDRCRALLDHLFYSSSNTTSFIVLKKALDIYYPWIAEQIDANDDNPVTIIPKNEKIKDKVISMYIDFTSEVDPKNIFDLLIRTKTVNLEEKRELMNKDTAEERCRSLIDHLFYCPKENAFIILREALKECYPQIVERIDAYDADNETDDTAITDKEKNERIRNRVVDIYEEFVSEVDPEKVLDFLIQNKTVNLKQRRYLKNQATTDDQCKALLDLLVSCSNDNVFVILKESLKEHYSGIVERIDSLKIDDEYQNNSDKKSTMRLESSIMVFATDYIKNDVFKINLNSPDEVSALDQLPKNNVNIHTAAAVYCGSVFVTGIGKNEDEIWRFDARNSKWNKCASLRKGRICHSVAFVDHILYICGGMRSYHDVFDDVEAYDAIDDKCSVVGKLTHVVHRAGNCVPYKASLYIFGGLNAQRQAGNSVQVYNTKFNACTILTTSMPRNSAHLRAALFKNYVILLRNENCFLYNFDTETFGVRDQFKTEVRRFGMTVHKYKLFVIGGIDSQGIRRNDVRYVPIENILRDEPIEWEHHAKLPYPIEVGAFGKLEFLVKQI